MARIIKARSEFDWHRKRAKPFRLMMLEKASIIVTVSSVDRLDFTVNGRAVSLRRPPLKTSGRRT